MKERLHKYLSRCGVGSRRACEQLITDGRITVNGKVADELGTKIDADKDSVTLDGKSVSTAKHVYIIINKPKGYVSAVTDKYYPTVLDLVDVKEKLFPVGRLDKDSTGLLLLTNDGDIAFRLTHPKYGHLKVYEVKIDGKISLKNIDLLIHGIKLEEGEVKAKSVKKINITEESSVIEISIGEGKKRQIKRMIDAVGFRVIELKRLKFGPLLIGNLSEGEWRHLTGKEVNSLKQKHDFSR